MIPGVGIKVEIAFATAPDSATPTWVDVTQYVLMNPGIQITRGGTPERGEVTPGVLTLTLKNDDGRFTPENTSSPYYPNVKMNRRIRVQWINPVGGAVFGRYVGFIHEWPTSWLSPDVSRVTITAADRMKRLSSQRTLRSVPSEAILADSPRAYFPLNESSGATTAGDISTAGVSSSLSIVQYGTGGELNFGGGTGPATDSQSALMFEPVDGSNGKALMATAPTGFNSANDQFVLEFTFNTTIAGRRLLRISNDIGEYVAIDCEGTGKLKVTAQQDGSSATSGTGTINVNDGRTHHVTLSMTGFPAAADITVALDNAAEASCNAWGSTFPTWTRVDVGGVSPFVFNGTMSHVAIDVATGHYDAIINGFAGESSDARIERVFGWAGVDSADMSLDAGSSTNIEHVDTTGQTALSVAQKIAFTESGPLFIDRDTGDVVLHSRSRRFGAAVTLALTASQILPSPTLTTNDENLANDITGKHGSGASYRATDEASITDPGWATDSLDLVTASDSEVKDRVDFELTTRATPRSKTPQIVVDLLDDTIRVSALALDISSRLQVTSMPSQAPSTLDLFVEGYTETISDTAWTVAFNTSAFATGGDVWTLEDPVLGALDSGHLIAY